MSANLNLASQPFRNRALPWTIAVIVTIASLMALALIIDKSNGINAQADGVEHDVKNLRAQESDIKRQITEVKSALTPDQLQTLKAAHALVDRKRFSWSRLFADLEAALPGNVRVTRISVRDVALRGDQTVAELDLTVVGKTPDDLNQMIADMDRTGIFRAEPLTQTWQKGRGESGTELTLYVSYTPRAHSPATSGGDNRIASATNTTAASSQEK